MNKLIKELFRFKKLTKELIRYRYLKLVDHPANIIKQYWVKKYQQKHNVSIFVETGTYMGEMIQAVQDDFQQIYSIEIGKDLYKKAKKKFSGEARIHILYGNSKNTLFEVLEEVNRPCLFWLDAHYSGGVTKKGESNTPIRAELRAILNHSIKNHIILIDDARCFNGQNDYPAIKEIKSMVLNKFPSKTFSIKDDMIRII